MRALRGEVRVLHRARGRLSRQLAGVWRERRALALEARVLASENGELRRRGDELEEQRREKNRELAEAVRRLRELADASRGLLAENTALKVLLAALRERGRGGSDEGGIIGGVDDQERGREVESENEEEIRNREVS